MSENIQVIVKTVGAKEYITVDEYTIEQYAWPKYELCIRCNVRHALFLHLRNLI